MTIPRYVEAIDALATAGRQFYQRGWVPATSGNFSARCAPEDAVESAVESEIVITASGRDKGALTPDDFVRFAANGDCRTPHRKSSAETGLHLALYRRFPAIGAIFHTHSPAATVLSKHHAQGVALVDYEVLKAFPGVDSHENAVFVPIFKNDQDIDRLAARVDGFLDEHPRTFGYLIAGHGFYTWGNTLRDAHRHLEAFEFLFECELLSRR